MRIKLLLIFRWLASCGTPPGGCAARTPRPSPNRRSSPWCSAARPLHSGTASPRPARAPLGHGPEIASGSASSPPASVARRVAFFRLVCPLHARLVALEAGVLQQRGLARVADAL